MRRITIIDLSSILHAAKHSLGKGHRLSFNGQQTFVIFGFVVRLKRIIEKTTPDIIVYACDSKNSIRKDKYFSQYKEKRIKNKTPEQEALDKISYPQFEIVKKIISYIGYKNVFEVDGFEADDILASICKKYVDDYISIVTSDEDIYQLLNNSISIIKPKNYVWYTSQDFIDEFNFEPKMWKRVKVYGGCKTDEVPGIEIPENDKTKKIRHVGPGTAINYIKGNLNPSSKAYKALVDPKSKPQILRNKILTILPLIGTPEFTIQHDSNLSKSNFLKVINQYGFKSVREDFDDYCKILRLK